MSEYEQLLGGYWFLHSYFFASFIAFAVIWLCRKRNEIALIGVGILLIISMLSNLYSVSIPLYIHAKEIMASSFIVFGYSYKYLRLQWDNHQFLIIPIGLIVLVLGSELWPCSMLSFTWQKTIPYAFSAIAGSLMVFSLCKQLTRCASISNVLTYIGDNTLAILTWHFLSFKIISLLIIHVYDLSITRLADFPVIEEFAGRGWWILYLIVGVTAPLLIDYFFTTLKMVSNKSFKKINKSNIIKTK